MKGIVERQSFELLSFRCRVEDARMKQYKVTRRFNERAKALEARLFSVSESFTQRLAELSRRVTAISNALSPAPIFQGMIQTECQGRITGMDIMDDLMALTTSSGDLVIYDLLTQARKSSCRPFEKVGLFQPKLLTRGTTRLCAVLAANGKLLLSLPAWAAPITICEEKVESFLVVPGSLKRESFDIITGGVRSIDFHTFNSDWFSTKIEGSSKKLQGTVSHLELDSENEAVYLLTTRRFLYCISTVVFNATLTHEFATPPLGLTITTMFVIVAVAANDLVILQRNRDRFVQACVIKIDQGLRYFSPGKSYLYVVTKNETVERRPYSRVSAAEPICSRDVAEYDEDVPLGRIAWDNDILYLAHGNAVSVWR
jgi:hypothetical protein